MVRADKFVRDVVPSLVLAGRVRIVVAWSSFLLQLALFRGSLRGVLQVLSPHLSCTMFFNTWSALTRLQPSERQKSTSSTARKRYYSYSSSVIRGWSLAGTRVGGRSLNPSISYIETVKGCPAPHSGSGSRPKVVGWPEGRSGRPDWRLDNSVPDPGPDPWVGL